jgi:predicted permease
MKWMGRILGRQKLYGELSEEMRGHLEEKVEELVASGMSRKDAEAAARREFGNVTLAEEDGREEWRWPSIENFLMDLRYGLRTLRKAPGFTFVAVLTLALGIGANTAVFTVMNGVLLRPMPFSEADRLFLVSYAAKGGPFDFGPSLSDREYLEFRGQDRLFERLAPFANARPTLTGAGDPVQIPAAMVTADFFGVLRASPEIGRAFLAGEEKPGNDNVVVLSNGLWKQRFGSDPQILGKIVQLDGVGRTVVGVMPAGFDFPYRAEVWTPLDVHIDQSNSFSRPVVGRLKAGANRPQAQAELETFVKRLPARAAERRGDMVAQILPLKELVVGNVRQSLLVFAGAVAFVLLIACANVANLFLARAAHREKEIGLRSALGAGRWRLVRQLLAESALVSLAGGAAGILLAYWGVPVLIALAPEGRIPRVEMIRVDGWVLGFTFGISVLTTIAFGLVPALRATRRDVRESLSQGGRGATRRHEGVRSALAISEIAMALTLLVGAGLMMKSFLRLRAVDPGFAPANVMVMTVDLPDSTYRTAEQMRSFHTRTLTEFSRLPGVQAAAAVNYLPLGEFLTRGDFQLEGGRALPPGFLVDKPGVSAGYFRAMGIRLVRGREFTDRDNEKAPGVVIVSESVARSLWPGEDPLGKRVSMEDHPKPDDWLSVVGVVEDVKQQGLAKRADPEVYQPYPQLTRTFFLGHMSFVVKAAAGSVQAIAPAIRGVLREVDRDQAVQSIAAMDAVVAATTAEPRFQARLFGTFAFLAFALAVVGIYGVLAYSVAQRTREIGVRMALGARRTNVFGMLLRDALGLGLAGVVIGGIGALAVTRALRSFLFEVQPADPQVFALVSVMLVVAAIFASYVPARRALRVDPMVALRHE